MNKIILLALTTIYVAHDSVATANPFLRSSATGQEDLEEQVSMPDGEFSMQSQISMKHIKHGIKEDHFPVFSRCYVDSFNKVHPKDDIEMKGTDVTKEIDVPEDANNPSVGGSTGTVQVHEGTMLGSTSTSAVEATGTRYYWARYFTWIRYMSFRCGRLCPDDDDDRYSSGNWPPLLQMVQRDSHSKLHDAFQAKFCQCLRESGLKTFEDVTECQIYYIHKPHGEADTEELAAIE